MLACMDNRETSNRIGKSFGRLVLTLLLVAIWGCDLRNPQEYQDQLKRDDEARAVQQEQADAAFRERAEGYETIPGPVPAQ